MRNGMRLVAGRFANKGAELFSAFSHRDFRWWQIGYALSLFGGSLQSMALSWWITDRTDSAWTLSWLKAMLLIPTILLILPAGVAADHFNRRRLLIALQWAGTMQAIVLCGSAFTDQMTVRLALSMELLGGIIFAFEYPLRSVFQSDLAPGKDMGSARAITRSLEYILAAIAQALAGYMLIWFAPHGYVLCFLLNAVSFGAAILTLHIISDHAPKRSAEQSSLRELADLIYKSRRLVELFIHKIILVSVGMFAMPLLPAFAKDELLGTSRDPPAFCLVPSLSAKCWAHLQLVGFEKQRPLFRGPADRYYSLPLPRLVLHSLKTCLRQCYSYYCSPPSPTS